MGESHTWKLSGYEVIIKPDKIKAGNGVLNMKNENEYMTKSFYYGTHAVIDGVDTIIHAGSVTGEEVNIVEYTIGSIEGGTYFNKEGYPITLNDVSVIYMLVEWWDKETENTLMERINLYRNNL